LRSRQRRINTTWRRKQSDQRTRSLPPANLKRLFIPLSFSRHAVRRKILSWLLGVSQQHDLCSPSLLFVHTQQSLRLKVMNKRIGSSNLIGINNRDPLDFASSKDYSQIPQITQIHLRVLLIC